MTKEEKIKSIVVEMLKESEENMFLSIDKVLKSRAIDIDGWDEKSNRMILPKIIITAILQEESTNWACAGTCFEKQVKKEVKNIRYFL